MKIGIGIAYYGGLHPQHAHCKREALRQGIPILEIKGCAYPEMARAEVIREALEARVDCVVIIDPHVLFTPDDVRGACKLAVEQKAVISAFIGPTENLCSFAAIPISIIDALAASETREYTNSAVINTGFSENSRPFFSPWIKAPGTLLTPPLVPGVYSTPDQAFRTRVEAAGFKVLHWSGPTSLGTPKMSKRIANAGPECKEKREKYGVTDYAICVPCFGPLDHDQQATLWELEKAGAIIVELYNCPYIDVARAELTRTALDELGCPGLFFLDHDIQFKPTDLIAMCKEAEERQDVVAAVYNMRKTAHALIGAVDVSVGNQVPFFDIGKVLPALYSGLGFAAIPRAVIDALRDTYPALDAGFSGPVHPLYALDVNGNFYSGEDASFCARVQGLAIKHIPGEVTEGTPNAIEWELKRTEPPTKHRVWLDTRVRIFHRGSYDYAIEDHGIAVPRYAELWGELKATRGEVREMLRNAAELNPETKIRAIGCDEATDHPHGNLEETTREELKVRQASET